MSLMGTLTKVAIGYAAARGIDKMSGGGGLAALFGGAQVPGDTAQAGQPPGFAEIQQRMGQMGAGAMGNLSEMMAGLSKPGGFDLAAMMGGGSDGGKGGLLSAAAGAGGGAGIAGLLGALGGAAAMTGQGAAQMADAINPRETVPQMEETAALLLRAMIQAAKSDGGIDADEQAKILETLGEADAEDMAFIRSELAAPMDVNALAAQTPEAQKTQVYAMSLMTIRLDAQAEADYLDTLAAALGLDQQTVNMVHMQMGVRPLYS
ncbi:DUF533 domain-containing protein [Aestuariivita sp.]|jgi:uncharacterized membrane protein YebE (DUF533 family)|uniref:DUF533 domain-containing protein n=1 Tax=Aestuariivita sp. TaxID=1872407 RepID=UPI002172A78E|nr:DUF533 domain-containing protein [Aestuariivita sp.]MCE8009294.1 tellurite resistance TerB family protein [Aestuariivita sp.]